jgi:dienelactone hydrolase
LSNPTGITLGFPTNATVTIVDNDPGIRFQLDHYWSSTYLPMESAGLQTVKVVRGNDRNLDPFTVSFATSDGTAKAGQDYTATNGTLSFAQGEMIKTFTVAIAPDAVVEDDETFKVTLSNPVGAELSATPLVTVTIGDSTGFEPHRFESIAMQPDRTLRLGLFGQTNPAYRSFFDLYPLETSNDLIHWTRWLTLVRTNASNRPLSLTNVETADGMSRFYRTPTNHIITPYPAPTGPYATGVSWRLLTDPTLRNRYNSSTNGAFMVSIWYPASAPVGRLPAPIWDERLWPYWASHSWQDAPSAASGGPFPVILYSHGYGNDRGSCSEKGPYFASHGYVVIAIDHTDADVTIFPNGSFFTGADTGLDGTAVQNRIRDLAIALAELERWSLDDPIFAGRLDLTKVAVMGFSFGGVTAGEMARTNPQCKAAVTLDAMPYGGAPRLDELGIQKPLLQINASDNSDEHIYSRNDRNAIYFRISNSIHLTMGGEDYYWTRGSASESAAAREAARTVNTCALSFLNKHVKGQDDHLLDTRPTGFPRIIDWKSK